VESRLPFSVEPKLPIEVTADDVIDMPLSLANDTSNERVVALRIHADGLLLTDPKQAAQGLSLEADRRIRQRVRLRPTLADGLATVRLEGTCQPFATDTVERSFRVVPFGYPVAESRSDLLVREARHEILLPDQCSAGSLRCRVQVY